MINKTLYKRLIEVAKNQGIIYYQEVADICGLNLSNPDDQNNKLCKVLDEINKYEKGKNKERPMLTAAVVLKNSHPPISGHGFFVLADELGVKKKGEDYRLFHMKELKKVHEFWKNKEIPQNN